VSALLRSKEYPRPTSNQAQKQPIFEYLIAYTRRGKIFLYDTYDEVKKMSSTFTSSTTTRIYLVRDAIYKNLEL
jgi:hypothetical protein